MSITMGNDEFILYIRKSFPNCTISNDQLGKHIWSWLRSEDPNASIIERDQPCQWGDLDEITSDTSLPKTATQFKFSIELLPKLYAFLGTVHRGNIA